MYAIYSLTGNHYMMLTPRTYPSKQAAEYTCAVLDYIRDGPLKNKKKIMQGKMSRKKIHAKKKVKKKFMQKEGPVVNFSHVVKKIRAQRGSPEKKFLDKQWAKKKFVQAENCITSRRIILIGWLVGG